MKVYGAGLHITTRGDGTLKVNRTGLHITTRGDGTLKVYGAGWHITTRGGKKTDYTGKNCKYFLSS